MIQKLIKFFDILQNIETKISDFILLKFFKPLNVISLNLCRKFKMISLNSYCGKIRGPLTCLNLLGILYSLAYHGLWNAYTMKQHVFKNVNNCLNTNIYSYLEMSGGKSFILYLYGVHFSTPVIIRHLWLLKTVVFLHRCLICTVLF